MWQAVGKNKHRREKTQKEARGNSGHSTTRKEAPRRLRNENETETEKAGDKKKNCDNGRLTEWQKAKKHWNVGGPVL